MNGETLLKTLTLGTLTLAVAACDPIDANPDAGDGTPDAGEEPSEIVVTSKTIPLSATGSDALYAVAYDAEGNAYAAGFTADGVDNASDRAMVVVKIKPDGALDETFGEGGVATKNVAVGGRNGEVARGVVVQSDGKVVIGGTIEADVDATGLFAADRDIALVRFNTDGSLDTSFGVDGVATIDLNEGVEVEGSNSLAGTDSLWDLALAADDKLVLHGTQRATGFQTDGTTPRADTDFVVVRLTKDGLFDTSFGDGGRALVDIEQANASPRGVMVLADGSVVGGGYANVPSIGTTQPVLYKLTPAGVLDPSFGEGGVFIREILAGVAEIYGFGLQGSKFVTAGYGRRTSTESVDWLSLRIDANGTLDTTWGDGGKVVIDVAGASDNARDLVMLDEDRALLLGGGSLEAGRIDAMFVVLGGDGTPDTSFCENGRHLVDLGGPSDMLWSGALSPDGKQVTLVGLKGAGTEDLGESNNDDAALVRITLP